MFLADEAGLGKGVQALCIAAAFAPVDWPLLVIARRAASSAWAEELSRWLPTRLMPLGSNLAIITTTRVRELPTPPSHPVAAPYVVPRTAMHAMQYPAICHGAACMAGMRPPTPHTPSFYFLSFLIGLGHEAWSDGWGHPRVCGHHITRYPEKHMAEANPLQDRHC